jgi:UDPglucose 6-dehydrogenase
MKQMKVGIIGSGVVGAAVGMGFQTIGHDVSFFDIDTRIVENLVNKGYKATTNIEDAAKDSEVFFICVPTPDKDAQIDLSIIKIAIKNLSVACRNRNDYFLVVVKSTVIPMTTENIVVPLLEEYLNKKAGVDFGVCFNPEFLNEAHPYEDIMNPDRIVIGEIDRRSGDTLFQLYETFTCPIVRTNLRTAEMVKYANNCFNATKISFFNEMDFMCKKVFIDSDTIRQIVQMDRYYGIHPWKHGNSFGGKCLPKDLNAIIAAFDKIHEPVLLKSVRRVNEQIAERERGKMLESAPVQTVRISNKVEIREKARS